MSPEPFADQFDFLLRPDRFVAREATVGAGFAEIYYRSPNLVVRLAEQSEIPNPGYTLICFLIDPQQICLH